MYNPSTKKFIVSRDVQFIEEEVWDESIDKIVNVKTCLSQEEYEEEMVERNPSLTTPPPPTEGQQGTPQAGIRTPFRSDDSASPSTSQGENLSTSTSTSSASERGTRFRSLNVIYEQEATNEGMKSLLELYFHVDDPIHFEEAIKDKKWIDATDEEMNAIEKNKTWELVDLP